MSVALKCDICGKFYEKSECIHLLKLSKRLVSNNCYGIFEGDICNHCVEKLSMALTDMGCTDSYINKQAEQYSREEELRV